MRQHYKNHRNYSNINLTDDSIEMCNILSKSLNANLDIIGVNKDAFMMFDLIWQCCMEYTKKCSIKL